MFGFLIQLNIKWIKNHPGKTLLYFFLLAFIVFHLFALYFAMQQPFFPDINVKVFLGVLPAALVMAKDFSINYKKRVFLLPWLYPVSNIKNAVYSLYYDVMHFTYILILAILIHLYALFDFVLSDILVILILIANAVMFKFFIHYLLFRRTRSPLILLLISFTIFAGNIYAYITSLHLVYQLLAIVLQSTIYFSQFGKFRYHYFALKSRQKKKKRFNTLLNILIYGFKKVGNVFTYYVIVKIGAIISLTIYYHINNEVFIAPMMTLIFLSPFMFYLAFHDNFIMLTYRVYKQCYLAMSTGRMIGIHLLIVITTSLLDFILGLPGFIIFEKSYLLDYGILFFSMLLTSFFLGLYFPKEMANTKIFSQNAASTNLEVLLYFFYITCVVIRDNWFMLGLIPIIVSVVLFLVAAFNYNLKLRDVFERFH